VYPAVLLMNFISAVFSLIKYLISLTRFYIHVKVNAQLK